MFIARFIMAKQKRELTPVEKAEKQRRQKNYMTIFINGKQKRVKRPPTIDGMSVEEFIRRNADPIWMHQNEMWECMDQVKNIGGLSEELRGLLVRIEWLHGLDWTPA